MLSFRATAAAAAVLAGATVSGLTVPGQAHAASPSVRVQICNTGRGLDGADITGQNQNGASVTARLGTPSGATCTHAQVNWWWKTGQTLDITLYWRDNSPRTRETCRIPSNVADGRTLSCSYRY